MSGDAVRTGAMHVRVLGAGEPGVPAVLVHGLGVSSRYMLPLARALSATRPVHAPDLPGFGRTPGPRALTPREMARALDRWMDAAELERAIVIGHSLGCQTAAHLAVDAPGRVGRLVLLAPTFDPRARDPVRQALRWIMSLPWERPAILATLLREYRDAGPRRILATLSRGLEDRIETVLPHARVPVLVVRGAQDPVVPHAWAEEVARVARDGRLRAVPGRGHAVNYSASTQVAALVEGFLAEHPDAV